MTMEELLTRICASKPEEASADHDCCAINNVTETEEPTQHCSFLATFRIYIITLQVIYELVPRCEDARSRTLRQMPRKLKLVQLLQTVKGKYVIVRKNNCLFLCTMRIINITADELCVQM